MKANEQISKIEERLIKTVKQGQQVKNEMDIVLKQLDKKLDRLDKLVGKVEKYGEILASIEDPEDDDLDYMG